jgi:predicted nucleic acid-binding protein
VAYFADTWYWAALFNREDQHHTAAQELKKKAGATPIVTSQFILMELLGMCSKRGEEVRRACCAFVKGLNKIPHLTVIPFSNEQYTDAVELYEQVSNDKEWSLVDCSSFLIMEKQKITVAITGDGHFTERPGITVLA